VWCGGGIPRIPADPAGQGQAYILALIERQGISRSYHNQVVSALRFMCESVLGQPKLALRIPRPKKESRLPEVLSQGEVARMLRKARNPKHRALLMLLYSAGPRVGEVVRLEPSDLDVERGLIRIRRGKGGKDRYTLLAQRAVEAVRIYRDAYPTSRWLFPGARPDRHLTTRSVQRIVASAAKAAGIEKKVDAPYPPPHLRHAPSRGRHEPSCNPGAPRSPECAHDPNLHARGPVNDRVRPQSTGRSRVTRTRD